MKLTSQMRSAASLTLERVLPESELRPEPGNVSPEWPTNVEAVLTREESQSAGPDGVAILP
jgi:hypothetical protein